MTTRDQFVQDAASRGKYAPLYRHLANIPGSDWQATFGEIEAILGFDLPDSARRYRPWWANRNKGTGHSHALAWQAAGWRTRAIDLEAETLVFARATAAPASQERTFDIDRDFPAWDPGPWPEGFAANREQLYDEFGCLPGAVRNVSEDGR